MRKLTFIVFILLSTSLSAEIPNYDYASAGVSFSYSGLKNDHKSGRDEPLSVVFVSGEKPFSVSVHFNEVTHAGSLETFMAIEKAKQKAEGYISEVKTTKIALNGSSAYEIIRTSNVVKIRWFIFESKRDNKLYSFWLVESSTLKKENNNAISGYESMKSTLKLLK